ncbi:unnamed protein product [Paramecium primaurelia]|uniref:Polycystin cation channel PKD1/PKD2 domain-containing protein n=1 Tax=Paramecium primaurelia TaxID=5886 RepID=A0A8S1MSE9_PARPR|nr:unnamed protein product [Paramecium primaurelia]
MSRKGQSIINEEEEILKSINKDDKSMISENKKEEEVGNGEKQEKEKDSSNNVLDEIEQIIANDAGFCTNFMLLIIYVVLIIQIYLEYRIPEVHETSQSIKKYISQRITTQLNEIQDVPIIYSEYLEKIIYYMHDHSEDRNRFSLLFNPLIENSSQYNESQYIFLENYNYYLCSVVSFTLKHVDEDLESDEFVRKIITIQNTDIYTMAETMLGNQSDMNFANQINISEIDKKFLPNMTIEQSEGIFQVKMFFTNAMEQSFASEMLSLLQSQFDFSSLFILEHDLYIINPLTEVILKLSNQFDISNQGRIRYQQIIDYGVYYYQGSNVQSNVVFGIVTKSLFAAVVFFQIVYTIGKRIFFMVIKFLSTRIFEFEFDLLFITAQRTLNFIYIIVWFLMFSQFQSISITPQITQEQIIGIDNYLQNSNTYQLFAITTFIITIYDIIKIMSSFFPTFGVLMYTFIVAGKDMIIFISFTAMALISFIMISNIIFGPLNDEIATLGNAAYVCFEFFCGNFKFAFLEQIVPGIGFIYSLLFFIAFNLILLPYFYGIIILTYGQLRQKLQLTTQALAEIAADKSTAATMKWINLIFFVPPVTEEQQLREKQKKEEAERKKKEEEEAKKKKKTKTPLSSGQPPLSDQKSIKSGNSIKSVRPDQMRSLLKKKKNDDASSPQKVQPNAAKPEEPKEKEKELTLKEIFMYNFQQLDIKNVVMNFIGLGQEDLLTKQQRIKEIKDKKEEIIKRQADNRKEMKEMKEKNLFTNLKDGFLHIIFLIFLIIGFQNQTLKSSTFNQEYYIRSFFDSSLFPGVKHFQSKDIILDDMESSRDIDSYIKNIIFSTAGDDYDNNYSKEQLRDFDVFVGYSPVRMTIRLYEGLNVNFFTENKDLVFRGRSSSDFSPSSGESSGEKMENLYKSGIEYQYRGKGIPSAAYQAGGYTFQFQSEISGAVEQYQKIQSDSFFTVSTGIINCEFIIYNPPQDLYSFVTVTIYIKATGSIEHIITLNTFPITLYSGSRLTRIVFELIVLYFHIKFWKMFLNQWKEVWNHPSAIDFTPYDLPSERKFSFVERHLNMDFSDKKNDQIVNLLFGIGKRIYGFIMRLLTSLKIMVQQTFFNILLITGILLMFIQIIYWLQIVFNQLRMSFDYYEGFLFADKEPPGMFNDFQNLASLFQLYNTMASFILFNEMIRIMVYFSFSAKLSLVLDIIASASIDIVFFMIMFCLIVFAFACVGVLSFGYINGSFRDLYLSVIYSLQLVSQNAKMHKSDGENYQASVILYYFLINIVILLVLIRMLIAILDGHFIEINSEQTERLGLVDTIMSILRNEYEKLKNEEDDDDGINNEDDDDEEKIYSEWAILNWIYKKIHDIKELTLLIYKYGEAKFKEYRTLLFGMLFENDDNKKVSRKSSINEEGGDDDEEDDNKLKIELDFDEDKNITGNRQRIESVEEIKIYNSANEAIVNLQNLTGKKLASEQFKTTQVSTWIAALEKGIQDIASNQLNFQQYYTPQPNQKMDWIIQFQFYDFEKKYKDLGFEIHGDDQGDFAQTIKQDQYIEATHNLIEKIDTQIANLNVKQLDTFTSLVRSIDFLFFFFTNIILVKNPEQYLERYQVKIQEQEKFKQKQKTLKLQQQQKKGKIKQPKQHKVEFDISLLDISNEVRYFDVDTEKIQRQGSRKKSVLRSLKSIKTVNNQQNNQSIEIQTEPSKFAKFNAEHLKSMNAQQIISVFSKLVCLFQIWQELKLNEKIILWFGNVLHTKKKEKQNAQPFFCIYHKLAFWNEAGWDKRTLQKISVSADDHKKLYDDYKDQNIVPEFQFILFWDVLGKMQVINQKSNDKQDGDEEADESNQTDFLPISSIQIQFVQQLLRGKGSKDLLVQVENANSLEKKVAILKNSHLQNDHKIIIWILMNPMEKMEMILQQEKRQQVQFMILMLLEELYDNFIMLEKIEKDFFNQLNSKIYLSFHNFAEFNALSTALNIRNKYTQQSVNDAKDYTDYIQFLELQLANSNQALAKYSDFLIKEVKKVKSKGVLKSNLGNLIKGQGQPQQNKDEQNNIQQQQIKPDISKLNQKQKQVTIREDANT